MYANRQTENGRATSGSASPEAMYIGGSDKVLLVLRRAPKPEIDKTVLQELLSSSEHAGVLDLVYVTTAVLMQSVGEAQPSLHNFAAIRPVAALRGMYQDVTGEMWGGQAVNPAKVHPYTVALLDSVAERRQTSVW